MSHTYTVVTEMRDFFTDKGGIEQFHVGVVKRDDGRQVWASNGYRKAQTARLQAAKQRKNAEAYYAHHGRCWLDDREAARAAKEATRKHFTNLLKTARAALQEGWDARMQDQPEHACPYTLDDSRNLLWRGGWRAAAEAQTTQP